jgi:hypothetical protein
MRGARRGERRGKGRVDVREGEVGDEEKRKRGREQVEEVSG